MRNDSWAAILKAPRKLTLEARPRPVAAHDQVLVKIAATAICHTDLDMYTGSNTALCYPVVMGHEATGTVESVGTADPGVKAGQKVLINPVITCGHCDCCERGLDHLCRNAGLFGRELEGSLSQYVILPAQYLYALPDALPFADATLIETLATVRHAQERARLAPGESVVVLGQGTTGLLHTSLAALTGCKPVIAISRSRWKLDRAAKMGAHECIEADADQAIDEVLRITGKVGADVVIDTAGAPTSFRAGIDMLRPGGRLCSFSLSHDHISGLSAFPLYYKEATIVASRGLTPADITQSIDLVASGKIDVSGFITTTYPLARAAEAFAEYESNPSRVLRIVIDSAAQ